MQKLHERKNKLTPQQEKEIYEQQWREVYNECFYFGMINQEKIASIMHSLNMSDAESLRKKWEKFEEEHGAISGIILDKSDFKNGK